MKKLLGIWGGIICCLCCLLCALPVKADVIWEPEDSFYQKHASECTYVNRLFTAKGPDGKVIVYQSPEMPIVVETWENGSREWISYTYQDGDGIVWGYCGGWMPMAYMEVVYDTISFEEEYADQIMGESGDLDSRYLGEEIYYWGYPGAENGDILTVGDQYTPSYSGVFTDEEGRKWGKVGYYFGRRNVWVCIDWPEADYEELYPNGGPQRGATNSQQGTQTEKNGENGETGQNVPSGEQRGDEEGNARDRIVPKVNRRLVTTAVVMVVLVAAVTAALLVGVKKGRKKF